MDELDSQTQQTAEIRKLNERLDLLGMLFYVMAGLTALFSLIPLIHVGMGVFFIVAPPQSAHGGAPPGWFGWLFVVIGLTVIALGETMAFFMARAGSRLRARTSYTFCQVLAALTCMNMPLGTILGVFTLITLQDNRVKAMFGDRIDRLS